MYGPTLPPPSLSRDPSPAGSERSMYSGSDDSNNEKPFTGYQRGRSPSAERRGLLGRWRNHSISDEEKYNPYIGPEGLAVPTNGRRGCLAAVNSKLPQRRWVRITLFVGLALLLILIILLSTLLTLLHKAPTKKLSFGSNGKATTDFSAATVDVGYGKYQGVPLSNNVTQWLGMRYSGPPIGKDRFKAPTPPVKFPGIKVADRTVRGCHGTAGDAHGDPKAIEDCVAIDVYAPSTADPTSKLPVYLFIQGGGNSGAAVHINGSEILQASDMGMVFATITYRVGAYGFLASSEVQSGASLNNGYKDQRQALQWVKNNIAKFGGDADSITIGGQSAGAGAILAQLAAYGKTDNNGLFHAAVIESPSMPAVRTVQQQQFQYDDLVNRLNCKGAKDTLACLQNVPHDRFLSQVTIIPFPDGSGKNPVFGWNPVVDDDFVPEVPASAMSKGHFVQVPMLLGDVNNEGSIFAPKATSEQEIWDFLRGTFPALNDTDRTQLDSLYQISNGTGKNATGGGDFAKKAADVYGEMRYVCGAHQMAEAMDAHSSKTPVWRYRFDALDPKNANNGVGVPHGAELSTIFGSKGGIGGDPPSYSKGGINAGITPLMQGYWTSFVMHHDPNVARHAGSPAWDTSSTQDQQRLHVTAPTTAMEPIDAGQVKRCEYIASIAEAIDQ